jgi:hypothetical protein
MMQLLRARKPTTSPMPQGAMGAALVRKNDAGSDTKRQRHDGANAKHQHSQSDWIVLEPMDILYAHDATFLFGPLPLYLSRAPHRSSPATCRKV